MKTFTTISLMMILSVSVLAGYTYEISSGYLWDLTLTGTQTLLMTGGGVDSLRGEDFSILEIQKTSPFVIGSGGIGSLVITNYSRLDFSGGQVYQLDIRSDATAVLSGGRIDEMRGYQYTSSPKHIEVICKSWAYNTTTKYLTGAWGDDSAFSTKLVNQSGYVPVIDNIQFTIIPEPTTLLLLSLGAILIRRK